jgi:prepilin signal peptidase PulO-like enzyme (type II secretory pathway)
MLERVPLALAGAVVGFCLGWLSAWVTEWLDVSEGAPRPTWKKLIKDPLPQGGSALAFVVAALTLPDWIRAAEAGLISVPLVQVAVTDLRTRYVYTYVAVIGVLIGLALGWQVHGVEWWTSVAGALGGFIVFGALWAFGRLVYRGTEPLARGDITIAAMVGAGAAACAGQALVLGVILSGLFAVGVWIARRSRNVFLPYGPGLCLGGLATLFWC